MKNSDALPNIRASNAVSCRRLLWIVLIGAAAAGLGACGSKDSKVGQSLARVDGQEITVLQLNEELKRANVQSGQQENASKQILESLIDRQLIIAEAMRNKIDRTPDVMQAVERSKAQIIAQAYLQSVTAKVAKPSKSEIDEYFNKNPQLFAKRKQFDMMSVLVATKDLNDEFRSAIEPAKSIDEVVAWMEKHNMQHKRLRLLRTTADLPPEMSEKLLGSPRDHLFVVKEGENTMLISILAVKDSAVTVKDSAAQIERYLINMKAREVAETEVAHLRSLAKIEYLNASAPVASTDDKKQTLTATETKPLAGL